MQSKIKNQRQLAEHIEFLEEKRDFYRARAQSDISEIIEIVKDPSPVIKRAVKNLAGDQEFRSDLFQTILKFAGRFVKEKMETSKMPGWLSALILKFKTTNT